MGYSLSMASVKGTIMLPLVKGIRAGVPGARSVLAPELHRYLEERIIVSEWYPEEDHLALLRVLGRAMGPNAYLRMGHHLAQFELGGVYKLSLHAGDARRTLRAFVSLWPQNHDTGKIELSDRKDGGARYTLTEFALPAREICEVVTGYLTEAMRMCIGETVIVVHPRCRANGGPVCVWDIDLPPAAATE